MPTPVFTWHPDTAWQADTEPKVRTANFGDGYSQRVKDGINNAMEQWSVRFTGTVERLGEINDFLKARGGADTFAWTTPEGDAIYAYCPSWQRTREKGVLVSVSAKFVQVPSP